VPQRRLANYRWLLARFGQNVAEPFADPSEGASPFVFPLRVADKPRALTALAESGVAGLDLWSMPHPSLPVEGFPQAAELRATTIGLPVHQELRPRDLDTIARAAASALGAS
jgi:dTDP-4-amino-4,6-dideoxygalactose transaminase